MVLSRIESYNPSPTMPKLPPYTIPEQDSDLWACGVVLLPMLVVCTACGRYIDMAPKRGLRPPDVPSYRCGPCKLGVRAAEVAGYAAGYAFRYREMAEEKVRRIATEEKTAKRKVRREWRASAPARKRATDLATFRRPWDEFFWALQYHFNQQALVRLGADYSSPRALWTSVGTGLLKELEADDP